jgi:hypothetical protein
MPPRYAYWTIIAGGLPTAFRAAERQELLPTFKRIQEKHPDATMRWFARGRLWDSPDAARLELEKRRARKPPGKYPARESRPSARTAESGAPGGTPRPRGDARTRDWRPGGEHRDPRQPFKDAKQRRNQQRRAQRFARKRGRGPGSKPS